MMDFVGFLDNLDIYRFGGVTIAVVILILLLAWIISRSFKSRRSKKKVVDVEGQQGYGSLSLKKPSVPSLKNPKRKQKEKRLVKKKTDYRKEVEVQIPKRKRSSIISSAQSVQTPRRMQESKPCIKKNADYRKEADLDGQKGYGSVTVHKSVRKPLNKKSVGTSIEHRMSKQNINMKTDYRKEIMEKEKGMLKKGLTNLKEELYLTETAIQKMTCELSVMNEQIKQKQKLREWSSSFRALSPIYEAVSSPHSTPQHSSTGYAECLSGAPESLVVAPMPHNQTTLPPSPPTTSSGSNCTTTFVGAKGAFQLSSTEFRKAIKKRRQWTRDSDTSSSAFGFYNN